MLGLLLDLRHTFAAYSFVLRTVPTVDCLKYMLVPHSLFRVVEGGRQCADDSFCAVVARISTKGLW